MDFSSYAIVTDLDGTFLHRGEIVPINLEAVKRFVAGGGLFTIATGRIKEAIADAVPHVKELINAPAVLCNGAYLYVYGAKKTIAETFIKEKHARELLDFIEGDCPHTSWRVSTPRGMRVLNEQGYMARDIAAYGRENFEVLPSLDAWRLDDWYKLVFRAEWEELAQIRALFEKRFAGHPLVALRSGNHFLEVFYRDCHKGTGLAKLREVCPLADRVVIACGDFENDIEMLQEADVGVCPANALPHVKAVADLVLCDSSEGLIDAVVRAIENSELKKRV